MNTAEITIYKFAGNDVRAVIDPEASNAQDTGIMRGDTLNLTFKLAQFVGFQIGDYCKLDGLTYRINRDVEFVKTFKRDFSYTMTMEGPYHQLSRPYYFTYDSHNELTEGTFPLTGRPIDFVTLAVKNMNRLFPTENWQVGSVLDGDYQTIEFDGQNCLEALTKVAESYQTEFTVESNKINLILSQPNSGITLEYGKGKALWSIERKNADVSKGIFTRLYVYGSSKNLGDNYRNGAQRLRMPDKLYLDKNVNLFGLYEKTVKFDGSDNLAEIFPTRTGVVTAVGDITTFTDDTMDFDVNLYPLPNGDKAKVTFNTGLLAGYTFEIGSYNNVTKTFVIVSSTTQTQSVPSEALKPAVGDEYVLVDMLMPDAYYTDAEHRLQVAGQKYLDDNGPAKFTFTVACNPVYFRDNSIRIKNGSSLTLVMTEANIQMQIRVVGFTRNLRNRNLYTSLTLANTVLPQTPIVKLFNKI
ncbi:phage tail protein [Mucilaginibacter ximonensis]|uniref:Phage tail protein n=1 Tax=Mucilaginibacter ximonensis TaxID=538021 RepID=A0ABW5YF98_9SPHI